MLDLSLTRNLRACRSVNLAATLISLTEAFRESDITGREREESTSRTERVPLMFVMGVQR